MGFLSGVLKNPLSADAKDPASSVSRLFGLRSPGEAMEDVSGQTAVDAIREGQRLQEEFGREALQQTIEGQLRQEETLRPFKEFGQEIIPGQEALFQGTVAESIGGSPVLQDLTQFAQGQIGANPALANLPQDYLDQSAMLTGVDLLSRERGDLLNAIGIGQASAAQQAAGLMDATGQRQDLLSQIGNVQAAGGIGQAQAYGQGAQNLIGGATMGLSAFREGQKRRNVALG